MKHRADYRFIQDNIINRQEAIPEFGVSLQGLQQTRVAILPQNETHYGNIIHFSYSSTFYGSILQHLFGCKTSEETKQQ